MTWSAFFDESGTHHESEWIVLAGYIFDDEQFSALDRKWKGMLESSKDSEGKSLPYFRMSDCAHNTGVFKNFTALQCDRIAREAISLITDHMTFGFAVSIDKKFAHLIPREELYDSPYSFACWTCLLSVRRWADQNEYTGDVAYFFEQGHDSQREADRLLARLFSKPQLKTAYRAKGHGFYDKRKVRPLQCADILAWHWYTFSKKTRKADITDVREREVPIRKDFSAPNADI